MNKFRTHPNERETIEQHQAFADNLIFENPSELLFEVQSDPSHLTNSSKRRLGLPTNLDYQWDRLYQQLVNAAWRKADGHSVENAQRRLLNAYAHTMTQNELNMWVDNFKEQVELSVIESQFEEKREAQL